MHRASSMGRSRQDTRATSKLARRSCRRQFNTDRELPTGQRSNSDSRGDLLSFLYGGRACMLWADQCMPLMPDCLVAENLRTTKTQFTADRCAIESYCSIAGRQREGHPGALQPKQRCASGLSLSLRHEHHMESALKTARR